MMPGLAGLSDATVLAIAADEGRLLVSHDVSTMPEHFARHCRRTLRITGVRWLVPS